MSKIGIAMVFFGIACQVLSFLLADTEISMMFTSLIGIIWMVGGIVLNEVVKEIKERDENDRSF